MSTSLPASMQAAVLVAPRRVELREVPVPEPGPDQVLVRLEGCGVCGSNLPVWEGREWFTYPLEPGKPGHEAWGRIAAVGADVHGLRPGERVAMLSYAGFAEYDVAAAGAVVPLPPALDGRPFPAEPLACAMNVFARSDIRHGDTVAVVGIGFLGALVTSLAVAAGATVIAVALRPFALEMARRMGAQHTIALDDHWRIVDEVKQLTGGQGVAIAVEAVGMQWPLDLAGDLVRVRGRLVIAGYHQDGLRQVNMQSWNWRGIDVINAHEREDQVYVDGMCRAVAAVTAGTLNPDPLYTHSVPLAQAGAALALLEERPDGFFKALVQCD